MVDNDTLGLEVLSRAQCLELLGQVLVGRIVLTVGALPAIMPVNFVLHGGSVVIRTDTGTKLAAAARNAVVAFEVDQLDATGQLGWSVSLVGRATEVTAPDELAQLRRLPLRPWAPGERDHYIRIKPELISGRRIESVSVALSVAEPVPVPH